VADLLLETAKGGLIHLQAPGIAFWLGPSSFPIRMSFSRSDSGWGKGLYPRKATIFGMYRTDGDDAEFDVPFGKYHAGVTGTFEDRVGRDTSP
jgi:hypothetical protein